MSVYGIRQSSLALCISSRVGLVAEVASWEMKLLVCSAFPPFPPVGCTQTPSAFASICRCHVPMDVQQRTFATCHENYSVALNSSINHHSTQTIQINAQTTQNLLFTCLVIASVAHAKSHWLLPSLVSQAGAPYGGEILIDSGGTELHRGPVTWQGLDIYCFSPGVSCWHEAQNS